MDAYSQLPDDLKMNVLAFLVGPSTCVGIKGGHITVNIHRLPADISFDALSTVRQKQLCRILRAALCRRIVRMGQRYEAYKAQAEQQQVNMSSRDQMKCRGRFDPLVNIDHLLPLNICEEPQAWVYLNRLAQHFAWLELDFLFPISYHGEFTIWEDGFDPLWSKRVTPEAVMTHIHLDAFKFLKEPQLIHAIHALTGTWFFCDWNRIMHAVLTTWPNNPGLTLQIWQLIQKCQLKQRVFGELSNRVLYLLGKGAVTEQHITPYVNKIYEEYEHYTQTRHRETYESAHCPWSVKYRATYHTKHVRVLHRHPQLKYFLRGMRTQPATPHRQALLNMVLKHYDTFITTTCCRQAFRRRYFRFLSFV